MVICIFDKLGSKSLYQFVSFLCGAEFSHGKWLVISSLELFWRHALFLHCEWNVRIYIHRTLRPSTHTLETPFAPYKDRCPSMAPTILPYVTCHISHYFVKQFITFTSCFIYIKALGFRVWIISLTSLLIISVIIKTNFLYFWSCLFYTAETNHRISCMVTFWSKITFWRVNNILTFWLLIDRGARLTGILFSTSD